MSAFTTTPIGNRVWIFTRACENDRMCRTAYIVTVYLHFLELYIPGTEDSIILCARNPESTVEYRFTDDIHT